MAGLLHAAFLEGIDHFAVDDLGDAVRDDDNRTAGLDGVDAVLDLLRGDGVQRGGGLVQEDDGRILQEHACDGNALLLAAGEVCRLVLELLGKRHDLVVDVRLLGSLHHLLVRGVRLAVEDVLLDGAVEDMVLLEHQANIVAQVLGVVFPEVDPVQCDGPLLRFVELVQQVHDGTLAGTGKAYQRGNLARFYGHVHPVKRLITIWISEIYIL